jgi:cupin 2 domain-containing protein
MLKNVYDKTNPQNNKSEIFEDLYINGNIKIERIISTGQKTNDGEWLSEIESEWVMLLQGNAGLVFDSGEKYDLKKGDYLLIPSYKKHRVEYTSEIPPCIWLAIHINSKLTQ